MLVSMDTALPPVIPGAVPPAAPRKTAWPRESVVLKLLFIGALVLLLQLPLLLVNNLREERSRAPSGPAATLAAESPTGTVPEEREAFITEGYRMVDRALKYSVLILALTCIAFFLFETLVGLRLHGVHYVLVGAAMCLFYLALLALGEVLAPTEAYLFAALASSLLIVLYSASILRSYARAGIIAALLFAEHTALFVMLRMETYALLAGTATLFAALGALMYLTRNVDWFAHEPGARRNVQAA